MQANDSAGLVAAPIRRNILPLPDAVRQHHGESQNPDFVHNPNHPDRIAIKGLVPDGTRHSIGAPKKGAKKKDTRPAFERKYGTTFLEIDSGLEYLDQKSGATFINRINQSKRMESAVLADKQGKIIAKVPKGQSVRKFAAKEKNRDKVHAAVYICFITKRKSHFGWWWKFIGGKKVTFAGPGKLISLLNLQSRHNTGRPH